VWVGLAKETAHQLGTPISSLMAWMEVIREDPEMREKGVVDELEKDIAETENCNRAVFKYWVHSYAEKRKCSNAD
jgi:hypothetical protein